MALPMLIYRDNAGLLCIPFIPVAVFNILYITFNIVRLKYFNSQGYEVAYDKFKVPWMFCLHDDNGIIIGEKQKLPFKVLTRLTPFVNLGAGYAVFMLCLAEILVGSPVFGCVFVLILIFIFLDVKKMNLKYVFILSSIINAFIISFTFMVIYIIPWDLPFQLLLGFVLLFALIYASYELLGRHLVKKGWSKK